jgi:hypothetical protein
MCKTNFFLEDYTMDFKKLSQWHLIAGIGGVVALIAYVLPWWSFGMYGLGTVSGFSGMGFLGFLGALAVVAVIVLKMLPTHPLPQIAPYENLIILVGGGLGILCVVLAIFSGVLSVPGFGYFLEWIGSGAVTVAGYFLFVKKVS